MSGGAKDPRQAMPEQIHIYGSITMELSSDCIARLKQELANKGLESWNRPSRMTCTFHYFRPEGPELFGARVLP